MSDRFKLVAGQVIRHRDEQPTHAEYTFVVEEPEITLKLPMKLELEIGVTFTRKQIEEFKNIDNEYRTQPNPEPAQS